MVRFHHLHLPETWLAIGKLGVVHVEDHIVNAETDPIYDCFIFWYKGGGNQKEVLILI